MRCIIVFLVEEVLDSVGWKNLLHPKYIFEFVHKIIERITQLTESIAKSTQNAFNLIPGLFRYFVHNIIQGTLVDFLVMIIQEKKKAPWHPVNSTYILR